MKTTSTATQERGAFGLAHNPTPVPKRTLKIKKSRLPLQPLQSGQIWELADSNLQIGLVGKRLVHYKHYKRKTKAAPVSLTSITALEKFLQENNASLLPA